MAHQFLPVEGVISTWVVENEEGEVTDFMSYYALPSTCLKSEKYDFINACFSYYNVATSCTFTELIHNAVIMAQSEGYDVYNCLNVMDNGEVFEELKFGRGSGSLHYYQFNWATNDVEPSKLGVVLV